MFIDAKEIPRSSVLKADICIIGAGIAGITIAREFINTKLDVILLESGGKEPKAELYNLNAGKNIGLPYYDLEEARVRAFGGTSHRWLIDIHKEQLGVRLRALDKIDFEERDWIPYSGWPFNKEHLDPFYERAHDIFKIGPYTYSPDYWEKAPENIQLPFDKGNIKTNIFQFARKNIFYDDYRKELEEADNITVYLNATVQQLEASENTKQIQRVSVATATTTNNHFSVESSEFILAAGGLENPRLLLLSNDVMHSGLGNQNDLVGRFFMEHPHLAGGIFYPSDQNIFDYAKFYEIHQSNGIPIMAKLTLDEKVLREERLLNFTTSFHLKPMLVLQETVRSAIILKKIATHGAFPNNFVKHVKNIIRNIDCIAYAGLRKMVGGEKEKWYESQKKYHGFKLSVMAEQLPDPESRVMLDSELDRYGQNRIKLDWKMNSTDMRSIRKSKEIFDREFRREGMGRLEIEFENDTDFSKVNGGWHHMGTTRMHIDPKQGVVDENCRIHNINNLFVAGSSVFPTGGYANPTLTIVALSVRLADHLKKRI